MPEKTFLINSQYGHSLSSDGSTFAINLKPPLVVPKDAEPMIEVVEATCWHVAENIKAGVNDVFKVSFANVSSNAVQTMTFPPGIYNLTSLNLRLSHFLIDLGLDSGTLRFVGVQATSSLLLHATPDAASGNITVPFADATMSMRSFLGFENNASVTFSSEGSATANSTAKFDAIQYYVLECNGFNIHGSYKEDGNSNSTAIAVIVPDVQPSQQILYRPNHPLKLHASIAGSTVSRLEFRLCDHLHQPVNTQGEYYSARIRLTY